MGCERPTWLLEETWEQYAAKRGEYLSSHQLADFRKSPVLYKKKLDGVIPDEDRPAYAIGRAVHTYVLEGPDAFAQRYAIGGPINPKTGQEYGAGTQAYAKWVAEQGRECVSTETATLAAETWLAVIGHAVANKLLGNGFAEGVVRAEIEGVLCQARLDWWNPDEGIVDLKTCDDLYWFEHDVKRYGYLYQLAFYAEVLKAAKEEGNDPVLYLIAVEKSQPYRCGVWRIEATAYRDAALVNRSQIRRLRECRESATWPTGYEGFRIIGL